MAWGLLVAAPQPQRRLIDYPPPPRPARALRLPPPRGARSVITVRMSFEPSGEKTGARWIAPLPRLTPERPASIVPQGDTVPRLEHISERNDSLEAAWLTRSGR